VGKSAPVAAASL